MNFDYVIVFITAPDEETGSEIARELLSQNLAACVNITSPIRSMYWWAGEVCNDTEVLLIVKTRSELFQERLVPVVKACHPYEVPEIIALPIVMGSTEYLAWIEEETQE